MLKTIKIIILLASSLAFLAGCAAKKILITPETVKNKGLLIAHLSKSDWAYSFLIGGTLIINGKRYEGAETKGYIVLPLPAGSYELESFYWRSSGSTGSVTTTSTSILPVKAKFTIKRGEITNLGEMFFYSRKKGDKYYNIIYLDNDKYMHTYLRKTHPDAYGKFRKKSFNKANVKYVKEKDLNKVRRMGLAQSGQYNQYVIAGPLGSIGLTKRNRKGAITSLSFVKTNTLNRPQSCTFGKTKTACFIPYISGDKKMFLADKTNYKILKKPEKFVAGKFIMLKDNSILWMNSDHTFYKTNNMGKSWIANTQFKRSIDMSFWEEMGGYSKLPTITQAKKGFYISTRSGDKAILYITYKSGKSKKINYPVEEEGIEQIAQTAKGLFAKSDSNSYFSDSDIYFKAHGQKKWRKTIVPKSVCRNIKVKNYDKAIVTVSCRDKQVFQTVDLGKKWKRIK